MPKTSNVMTGMPKAGASGYLFRAPLGTALPTDEATTLNVAFKDQGFVSEDGVERAISKAYNAIRDMGGTEVYRARSEHSVQLSFALLESLNGETMQTVYGTGAVTITAATASSGTKVAVAYKGEEVDNSVWVLDTALGGKVKRYVFPNAQLASEDQTVTIRGADAVTFPVTLGLQPDASGVFFYEYSNDGVFSA